MRPSEIQRLVVEALAADEELVRAGCGASPADDGSVQAKVNKALGTGGAGVHAIVGSPRFAPESSAAKNAVGTLYVDVALTEVPSLNRRRGGSLPGCDLAWRIAWALNQLPLGGDGPLLVLAGTVQGSVDANGATAVYTVPFKCLNQLKG